MPGVVRAKDGSGMARNGLCSGLMQRYELGKCAGVGVELETDRTGYGGFVFVYYRFPTVLA